MKLTITKDELGKIYEGVRNSDNREAIIIFNKIFGNKPSPNITLEIEGNNTVITLDEDITLPLLDIISKNSYGVSQVITSTKNPLSILSNLKRIYHNLSKEILKIFK